MTGKYEDIIHMPHHRSRKRAPMSLLDRAAQFSPFAALTGYEEAIAETGRLTESFLELDSGGETLLDSRLRELRERLETGPLVTVRYFCPDERKQGGAYVNISGHVKKIDEYEQFLQLEEGPMLYFSRIYEILL